MSNHGAMATLEGSSKWIGGFATAGVAMLALTFWLGTQWALSDTAGRAPISGAAVQAAPTRTAPERKSGLDPADPAQVAAGLDRGAAELGDYRKQTHLARVAGKLDLPEVTAALDAEEVRGALGARHEVIEALVARYAEIDPVAATVRAAQLYEKMDGYSSWMETALAAWWKRDPGAARRWVGGLPPGSTRDNARSYLAEFLAASDPVEALRQGMAQDRNLLSGWDVRDLFQSLARGDLALAAENARRVAGGGQDEAVEGVLKVWLTRDPAAAYAWATTTAPNRSERGSDVQNFYELWCQQDPAAAGNWALAHELAPSSQSGSWNNGFARVIKAMTNRDPAAAQSFVTRLPVWAQQDAREKLCSVWTEKDPAAAADYALACGVDKDGGASKLTRECVKNWAGNDLDGARVWVERMPPGKAREDAMGEVCEKWYDKDPKSCVDYLFAHQEDSGTPLAKNTSFQSAAGKWAEESPDEMLRWSQALPDAELRDAVLKEGARMVAGDDWTKTARMVAAISPAKRGAAVKDIVEGSGISGHPEEAKALVEALPNDQTAKGAAETFVLNWGENDPAAAAAWVATRPAGPVRDSAASSAAYSLMQQQSVGPAAQALALIQDPKERAETLESMAEIYVDKDQAAGKAWITSSPLFSPKLRAKCLRAAEKSSDEKEDDADDE